ncbi:MAG: alpha/beta hydrolase [Chitinophagaceae bacterium]|nr:alpha/beta hydrolase [Chitinophagaceae bacterium]
MQSLYLPYKSSQVHFWKAGEGNTVILCFHGYGETADSFEFLDRLLPLEQYILIAVDLPFHGKTVWRGGNFFPDDLQKITQLILKQCAVIPDHRIIVVGFSLGGRIALQLYQSMPALVHKIVLLAPDGLKVNFWYWLATQTRLGNRLFALTMKKPGWFFGLLKVMNLFKLVNASIFKFVNYYIGDAEVRRLLYSRWTSLRKIKPDPPVIKNLIRKNNTTVRLIYGQHDRIIISSTGEQFQKGIEEYCTLSVIHSGHQVLHEKHIKEILPALMQ